jgi:hypothetical protein
MAAVQRVAIVYRYVPRITGSNVARIVISPEGICGLLVRDILPN